MFSRNKKILTTREVVIFAMLGAIMFASKVLMEFLPNVHPLGMFTMVYTLTYRKKALFPIYVYVLLNGIYAGFNIWWIPYLYLWTILWAVTMLLPKNPSVKAKHIIYPSVCCLHGLLFGTLYAPAYAISMGLDFKQTVAWIVAGLPWDCIHGGGNLVMGLLICPLCKLLEKVNKQNNFT